MLDQLDLNAPSDSNVFLIGRCHNSNTPVVRHSYSCFILGRTDHFGGIGLSCTRNVEYPGSSMTMHEGATGMAPGAGRRTGPSAITTLFIMMMDSLTVTLGAMRAGPRPEQAAPPSPSAPWRSSPATWSTAMGRATQ